jgi:hypothetical protein
MVIDIHVEAGNERYHVLEDCGIKVRSACAGASIANLSNFKCAVGSF